ASSVRNTERSPQHSPWYLPGRSSMYAVPSSSEASLIKSIRSICGCYDNRRRPNGSLGVNEKSKLHPTDRGCVHSEGYLTALSDSLPIHSAVPTIASILSSKSARPRGYVSPIDREPAFSRHPR